MTGHRGGEQVLISINFDDLHSRVCSGANSPDTETSDYETWEPSDSRGDLCLLGRKTSYTRRIQTKDCQNPPAFRSTREAIQNCSCTEENYECDYCFVRNEFNECVLDTETCADIDPYKVPEICIEKWYRTQGYRRVPGDTCDHTLGIDHTPVEVKCDNAVPTTGQALGGNDFLALIIIIALPVFGSLAFFSSLFYYCTGKNEKVRDCAMMCVNEDMLPAYTSVPFSVSIDEASMIITESGSKSSNLDV